MARSESAGGLISLIIPKHRLLFQCLLFYIDASVCVFYKCEGAMVCDLFFWNNPMSLDRTVFSILLVRIRSFTFDWTDNSLIRFERRFSTRNACLVRRSLNSLDSTKTIHNSTYFISNRPKELFQDCLRSCHSTRISLTFKLNLWASCQTYHFDICCCDYRKLNVKWF